MVYDVIIIGGGPCGCTAAMYCVQGGQSVLLLEKLYVGGQLSQTGMVENYPGFEDGVDGADLGRKIADGAVKYGAEILIVEVIGANLDGEVKTVRTGSGEYYGRCVIIASGAGPKLLGIAHETELIGKGVSYCALCDGMMFRGKTVAVIGGGETAVSEALYLGNICKKVYLIHRRVELRAGKKQTNAISEAENIELVLGAVPERFTFDDRLQGICVKNTETGAVREICCDGVFVAIGRSPETELFGEKLTLDEQGYIAAGEDTKTNIPGVFAAGDVRAKPVRQIVTAVADGATAAKAAMEFLK